jgi:hypothetical protein
LITMCRVQGPISNFIQAAINLFVIPSAAEESRLIRKALGISLVARCHSNRVISQGIDCLPRAADGAPSTSVGMTESEHLACKTHSSDAASR